MFFCDCASRCNTALDSVSSTLRYCMTAPRANLEIVRLVAKIRRLSSQRLCKNKIFGKVSATQLINYCFKFERALSYSSGGRGVDQLLVVGNGNALV